MAEQPGSAQAEATPFWFGPGDRELFGWLHLPADRVVRGGVVLCQPLGIEAICVYFSYRLLAERLAQRGLAVLRFDYDGTGDSSGLEDDPDRLDAWLESVSTATDALTALGVDKVGLVGVRIGALFAAHEATRRGGVDALVLWDPCLSGRAFLREQRFLRLLSGTGADQDDGAVDAPGLRFEPETVKALSDLDLGRLPGSLARRTLVLIPPDVPRPKSLERRLEGVDVDWQEATGQDLLLDSSVQEPPLTTIGRVTEWLSGALDGGPMSVSPPDRPSAIVSQMPTGEPVLERTVRLGPLGLFGIVTEPAGTPVGPTVVLVNEGNTHHIGQARIWVDLARRVAGAGFRVLRFDLSGIGDSGTRPGQRAHVSRAPEAIEDVYEAMRSIRPDDPTDVVLVGFCSGAYEVIEQALAHPPRGICVINPTFSFLPPEPAFTADRPGRQYTRRWFASGRAGPAMGRREARLGGAGPLVQGTRGGDVAGGHRQPTPRRPVGRVVGRQSCPHGATGDRDPRAHRRRGRQHPAGLGPRRPASGLHRGRGAARPTAGGSQLPAGGSGRARPRVVDQASAAAADRRAGGVPRLHVRADRGGRSPAGLTVRRPPRRARPGTWSPEPPTSPARPPRDRVRAAAPSGPARPTPHRRSRRHSLR